MEAGGGQSFSVGAEGEADDSAEGGQITDKIVNLRCIQFSQQLPVRCPPVVNGTADIATDKFAGFGNKVDAVGNAGVSGKFVDQLPIGGVPDPDQSVVSTGGDLLPVGTDSKSSQPAPMCLYLTYWLRCLGCQVPCDPLAIVGAGPERGAIG